MPPLTIRLSQKQLDIISKVTRKGLQSARVIMRANILRFLHKGLVSTDIADLLEIDSKTVTNTANCFIECGIDRALYDDPRTGQPLKYDDAEKARLVALVCSDPPDGYARWTLELIKKALEEKNIIKGSISKEQIRIILMDHELKPWQEKMWCIGEITDEYIDRMETILDLYSKPYDEAFPVLCIDEKPVALISDKVDPKPCAPGKSAKKDYEYKRNGSVNVFCGVECKKGRYFNKVTDNRKGSEFAKFLNELAKKYPAAKKIRLVMDNLSTHTEKSLKDFYGDLKGNQLWEKFEVYYTPKHASWLNQAEIAIGMYSRQCLGDGRIGTLDRLKQMTKIWNKQINKYKKIIQWKFNTENARKKFDYTRKN